MSFYGFAQTKDIDSLKTVLKNTSLHDTVKIKTNFILAGRFGGYSLDSLKKYTLRAIDLSKSNENYMLDAAYFYMGSYYDHTGDISKAKESYLNAIPLIDSIKEGKKLAKALSNYGGLLNETDELTEKLSYNMRALKLREKANDPSELGKSQFNLAVIYSNTGFDSLSVNYLELALKNAAKSKEKVFEGYVLNSLIMYALKDNNNKKIEEYLAKSEEICLETGSPMLCYNTYLRKGTYFDKLKKFEEAEISFKKSIEFAKKRKSPGDIMHAYASLGKHYVKSEQPKMAIESFKNFEKHKTNSVEGKISQLAYSNWSKAERMVGNYKNSNEYLQKYIDIKDSMNVEKNKILLANSETKYQSEKKDKEIAQQQLILEKSQTKTQLMTILIVSLLLASILLWFVFQQRQKRIQQQLVAIRKEQEVLTLESLIEGEEKERLRIAKELHDGVNGDLSAIKYKLSSLLKMNNEVINEAVTMIDNSCKQVRAISHNLVPPSLKDFNLIEAVNNYCENINSIHKPEINFQHIGDSIDLNKKVEVNIFRIIQELVTNAIKHSDAKTIDVQISNRNNTLLVTVEDNGKGYKNEENDTLGIGLSNIKSRVEYLDANLDVVTNENGTSNTVEIDLNKINDN